MTDLNDRQIKLLLYLLDHARFLTAQELGEQFQCSSRTIRNDVDQITGFLQQHELDANIERKPSEGIIITSSIKTKHMIKLALLPETFDHDEPSQLLHFLARQTDYITIDQLIEALYVSRSKALSMLERLERFLAPYDVSIERIQHKGIRLVGEEWHIRSAMKDFSYAEETQGTTYQHDDFQLVLREFKRLEQKLDFPMTDRARNNLLYHTLIFVQRLKTGHLIQFPGKHIQPSVRQHAEYELALEFVSRLSHAFNMTIPEQEADYMALHLIGSRREFKDLQLEEQQWEMFDQEAIHITNQMMDVLASDLYHKMGEDQEFKQALVLHFQSTLHRLRHGLRIENPILSQIKDEYPFAFEWVDQWISSSDHELLQQAPDDEKGFIAIHLQSAIERYRHLNEEIENVLIICSTGFGTAQLIKQKFLNLFPSVKLVETTSVQQWKLTDHVVDADLIISTVAIEDPRVFQISSVFSKEDQRALSHWLQSRHGQEGGHFQYLKQYVNPEAFYVCEGAVTMEAIIKKVSRHLHDQGYVTEQYQTNVMEREALGSTAVGGGLAIPHGKPDDIRRSVIAPVQLQHPIRWGDEDVYVLLFLAVEYSSTGEAEGLFKEIFELSSRPSMVRQLAETYRYEDWLALLK
ncbi:transcription antiterminator [Thalassobacillus sp. CUG 92003]|uniref:BglG family transcription antiterminator n=1 Tax=Thalassobacillus sp. CUG 92003 TaxID=2736641 RepID=UPI0015E75C63|nr:PRD domain-containing protein [Thalassobacillus sp. CUG 92003]